MFLLIFEFIGTSEFILIMVAALILFGPRKLPGLARSVGKSLSEFKRASEEFKDQWEREVEREASGARQEINSVVAAASWETRAAEPVTEASEPEPAPVPLVTEDTPAALPLEETPAMPTSKRDWL
jgi:sec-independent protein translocase protein TatB